MGEGSVTGLNYGWFIMQVPETLIGTALAIAVLPTLAEHFARNDDAAFVRTLNRGIRAMLALSLPAAAILAVGVRPLVGVLGLEPAVSDLVVWTTRAYLAGLVGHTLLEIAARSFYARQDALIPLAMAFLNAVLLYTLLALVFGGLWGVTGIALANSLAFTVEAILLLFLLRRRLEGVGDVRKVIGRVAAASLIAGAVVAAVQFLLPFGAWGVAISALVGAAVMAAGGLLAVPFIWGELRELVRL
jgi:putative peptidoglycan lipid II flippase